MVATPQQNPDNKVGVNGSSTERQRRKSLANKDAKMLDDALETETSKNCSLCAQTFSDGTNDDSEKQQIVNRTPMELSCCHVVICKHCLDDLKPSSHCPFCRKPNAKSAANKKNLSNLETDNRNKSKPETIEVTVVEQNGDQAKKTISIGPNNTAELLYYRVVDAFNLPIERIQLSFNGKLFDDDGTTPISKLGISRGSTIQLKRRRKNEKRRQDEDDEDDAGELEPARVNLRIRSEASKKIVDVCLDLDKPLLGGENAKRIFSGFDELRHNQELQRKARFADAEGCYVPTGVTLAKVPAIIDGATLELLEPFKLKFHCVQYKGLFPNEWHRATYREMTRLRSDIVVPAEGFVAKVSVYSSDTLADLRHSFQRDYGFTSMAYDFVQIDDESQEMRARDDVKLRDLGITGNHHEGDAAKHKAEEPTMALRLEIHPPHSRYHSDFAMPAAPKMVKRFSAANFDAVVHTFRTTDIDHKPVAPNYCYSVEDKQKKSHAQSKWRHL